MALSPQLAAYLMQAAQATGQDGPLIPPAPPGYPPNTQPLPMDMPQAAPVEAPQVSQDIQGEEEIVAKGLDPIEHKGLFGVKGTLRDVLGLLGDTYLMANGRDPYYAPIRERESQGGILAGQYQNNEEENFINNPALAIQRLAEQGYSKEAQSLYQDYTKNQQAEAVAKLNEARLGRQELRDAQLAKQGDIAAQDKAVNVISRLITGARSQQELDALRGPAEAYLRRAGLVDPETGQLVSPLPTKYGEGSRTWGIQPYQAERLEDFDTGLGIQQQRANTDAATSRPRADTPLEEYRRLSGIPENRRTPEQKAFMNKYTSTGKRSGRRTGGGGSSEGLPPRPGTYNGQTATSPSGVKYTWDGKSWKR